MSEKQVLEKWDGHEVTEAGLRCNIGTGLAVATKIDPRIYRSGEIVEIVVRGVVDSVEYDPVAKEDYSGDWSRQHVVRVLVAGPVEPGAPNASSITKYLDKIASKVSKYREQAGQRSIDDELEPLEDE